MLYLICYHEVPEKVSYFTTESDEFLPFHGVLINGCNNKKKVDGLMKLLFDSQDEFKPVGLKEVFDSPPLVLNGPVTIIHLGFLL